MSSVKSNDQIKPGFNSFDFDGVVSIGIMPGPLDVIITGRTEEEREHVEAFLKERGLTNKVYFQQVKKKKRTREMSGLHKARTLKALLDEGFQISKHFEDDPIQINVIKEELPDLDIVAVCHTLTEK